MQRKAVMDAIQALSGHPTAADVFARVRNDYPNLSLATVYRALHALVARGDVVEVRAENVSRYDAGPFPHHHIVCRRCGAVTDVPALLPEDLLASLQRVSGYVMDEHPIQFTGFCPACHTGDASVACS